MNVSKLVSIFLWGILTLLVAELATSLLTAANTIANIAGLCIGFAWIVISIKTKIFINIKIKKNNEKD